jgi:hypothetical protein
MKLSLMISSLVFAVSTVAAQNTGEIAAGVVMDRRLYESYQKAGIGVFLDVQCTDDKGWGYWATAKPFSALHFVLYTTVQGEGCGDNVDTIDIVLGTQTNTDNGYPEDAVDCVKKWDKGAPYIIENCPGNEMGKGTEDYSPFTFDSSVPRLFVNAVQLQMKGSMYEDLIEAGNSVYVVSNCLDGSKWGAWAVAEADPYVKNNVLVNVFASDQECAGFNSVNVYTGSQMTDSVTLCKEFYDEYTVQITGCD